MPKDLFTKKSSVARYRGQCENWKLTLGSSVWKQDYRDKENVLVEEEKEREMPEKKFKKIWKGIQEAIAGKINKDAAERQD